MTTSPLLLNANPSQPASAVRESGDAAVVMADGLSLRELLQILSRRRLWFGVTFGVCLSAVGLVTLRQWLFSPTYQGSFRLLVEDPLSDGRSSTGRLDDLALQSSSSVDAPNLIDVLTSPMLLDPLARQLNLPAGSLGGRVSISRRDDKSDVLDVSLQWSDTEQGLTVLKGLEKAYLAYSLQQRQEKLTEGLKFLDSQAPTLQQRVADVQQELAEFRRENAMLAPEDQSKQLEVARAELEEQQRNLRQVEARLLGMQALVQRGQLLSPFQGESVLIGRQPNLIGGAFTPLFNELTTVESQLAAASSAFRSDSPLVRSLTAKRNKLRPLLQKRELDAITSALQENLAQQRKVDQQVLELDQTFRTTPDLIKRYEAVQQRLDVARENLVSYLRARETFRLEVAQRTVPWQVIQQPSFGVIPVKPDLQRNLVLGTLLGLIAGAGVAFTRDRLDHVFHRAREVEQALGLPMLAGIPFLPIESDQTIQDLVKSLDGDKRFALRESLRNFYQALRMLRANRALRVIAITSSAAGEGKTTSASLLGQTLSELGMKVLLVDADLRRTRLHRRLGVDNARGWSELFGEDLPEPESLCQWVSSTLAVLPAGPRVPDPAKLLSSARCGEAIQQIRDLPGFDLVLFDTPPAAELVDPLLLAEHMDGLLLLVSMGRIDRDLPAEVVRRIASTKVDLLGVVLNQRVALRSAYGYGYGSYGYGYGYGYAYGYGYGYGNRYGYGYGQEKPQKPLNPWLERLRQSARRATTWLDGEVRKPETPPEQANTDTDQNAR